jgi:hypothetical protein
MTHVAAVAEFVGDNSSKRSTLSPNRLSQAFMDGSLDDDEANQVWVSMRLSAACKCQPRHGHSIWRYSGYIRAAG